MKGRQNTAQHGSRHNNAYTDNGGTYQSAEVFRHGSIAPGDFLLFVNVGSEPIEEPRDEERR